MQAFHLEISFIHTQILVHSHVKQRRKATRKSPNEKKKSPLVAATDTDGGPEQVTEQCISVYVSDGSTIISVDIFLRTRLGFLNVCINSFHS